MQLPPPSLRESSEQPESPQGPQGSPGMALDRPGRAKEGTPLFGGWLWKKNKKRGRLGGFWAPRYFVVLASPGRSTLSYYRRLNEAHAGMNASDEIDLTTCEVVRESEAVLHINPVDTERAIRLQPLEEEEDPEGLMLHLLHRLRLAMASCPPPLQRLGLYRSTLGELDAEEEAEASRLRDSQERWASPVRRASRAPRVEELVGPHLMQAQCVVSTSPHGALLSEPLTHHRLYQA